eukprot:CAMPEP_0175143894 /NCGR_PEP_ID=MMETSP0087-20121206/13773_1 /TAXON_ID=136419 /ORGANISM="Unknown Unknown, Strain D1" /LENGTH=723 /DNA_ID=CAMNT_0016428189 /DNA_START=26 /DNA_END=2197 /DNA_ORIENTATION=+
MENLGDLEFDLPPPDESNSSSSTSSSTTSKDPFAQRAAAFRQPAKVTPAPAQTSPAPAKSDPFAARAAAARTTPAVPNFAKGVPPGFKKAGAGGPPGPGNTDKPAAAAPAPAAAAAPAAKLDLFKAPTLAATPPSAAAAAAPAPGAVSSGGGGTGGAKFDPFANRAALFRGEAEKKAGPAAAAASKIPGAAAASSPSLESKLTDVLKRGPPPGAPGHKPSALKQPANTSGKLNLFAPVKTPTAQYSSKGVYRSPYRAQIVNKYGGVPSPFAQALAGAPTEKLVSQIDKEIEKENVIRRASVVKKPVKEWSKPDHQAVISVLSTHSLLVASTVKEIAVTPTDLNAILSEGEGVKKSVAALKHLCISGRRFTGFDQLLPAVQTALDELERGRVLTKQLLGSQWSSEEVDKLFYEGEAGVNTCSFLKKFVKPPYSTGNMQAMVQLLQQAAANSVVEGKNALVKYLTGGECSLFAGTVQLKQSDLAKIITAGGGAAPYVLSDLRVLDGLGVTCSSVQEVVEALQSSQIQNFKSTLLTCLFKHRVRLFKSVLQVPVNRDSVNQLLVETQGGADTPEIVDTVACTTQNEDRFDNMEELVEHVKSFADTRRAAVTDQIEKVFAFLGKVGLFKGEVRVQNSDMKRLVRAIFLAHYPITGGDCVPVLAGFAERKMSFSSFDELVKAIADEADVIPLPPEEEVEFDWVAPEGFVAPPPVGGPDDEVPPPPCPE